VSGANLAAGPRQAPVGFHRIVTLVVTRGSTMSGAVDHPETRR
jgi:hypothetical protein